jgi:hypothetical protein
MSAKANSASRLTQGNSANLLKDADGKRAGAGCKSDTLLLFQNYWVQTNVSGKLKVRAAEGREPPKDTAICGGAPTIVTFAAGVPSAFQVCQIFVTDSDAGITEADIVLIS